MTDLKIYINTGTVDDVRGGVGAEFTEMSLVNDYFIFSKGSDVVADGEPIPSSSDLNQAGIVISDSEQIVPKYFLADVGDNILREIHLAGNQNKRYVFCFAFDGATASEPVLEMWDNSNLNTFILYSLGTGIATNSWFRGIATTNGEPGPSWVGSRLAGSAEGYFLNLNGGLGALSGAKDLFCNLKVVVPASFGNPGSEQPIICIKYTTN